MSIHSLKEIILHVIFTFISFTLSLLALTTYGSTNRITISSKDSIAIQLQLLDSLTSHPISKVSIFKSTTNSFQQIGYTNEDGFFNKKVLIKKENLFLTFKHVSYEDLTVEFKLSDPIPKTIRLRQKNIIIDSVDVTPKGNEIPTDTISFILDSLSTAKLTLEKVINGMKEFNLKDGLLYFQGKLIDKVLVNGEIFFYSDPSELLKLLPAYMINKIQVYDTEDTLSFSDKGNKQTEINLITYKDKTNGVFGNFDVTGGKQNRKYIGATTFLTIPHNKFHTRASINNIASKWEPKVFNTDWKNQFNSTNFTDLIIKYSTNKKKKTTVSSDLTYKQLKLNIQEFQSDSILNESERIKINSNNNTSSETQNIDLFLNVEYKDNFINALLSPQVNLLRTTYYYHKRLVTKNEDIQSKSTNKMDINSMIIPISSAINFNKKRQLLLQFSASSKHSDILDSIKTQIDQIIITHKETSTQTISYGTEYRDQIFNPLFLRIGVKQEINKNKSILTKEASQVLGSTEEFYNSVLSYFSNLSFRKKKYRISAIVSKINATEQYNFVEEDSKRNYQNLNISSSISYRHKKVHFTTDFTQSAVTPSYRQITADISTINNSMYYIGNPSLKNGKSQRFNTSISYIEPENLTTITFTVTSSFAKNDIRDVTMLLINDTTINGVKYLKGTNIIKPINGLNKRDIDFNLSLFKDKIFASPLYVESTLSLNRSDAIFKTNREETSQILSISNKLTYQSNGFKSQILHRTNWSLYKNLESKPIKSISNGFQNFTEFGRLTLFNIESFMTLNISSYPNEPKRSQLFWNLGLSRHFLRSERLKVLLSLNNVLNTTEDYSYNIVNNIYSNNKKEINGRLWLLSLTYNFHKFGF